MTVSVTHSFRPGECMEALGLEEHGRVQRRIVQEILKLSDPYVPFNEGELQGSGRIEEDTDVVWDTPYAAYMWNGIVYEDPELHCAGFKTEDGWRSRKGVEKVPTTRSLEYQNGKLRGSKWADRMLQNGGLKEIEKAVMEEIKD